MTQKKVKDPSLYQKLGVDSDKDDVRAIFHQVNQQEYPGAFVNIITAPFNEQFALTQHQDGDGSKFVQRLLYYYETGDATIFRGAADDALSMNSGDISAAGFLAMYIITNVLNLGSLGEASGGGSLKDLILRELAIRFLELKKLYSRYGLEINFLGGETADLPDQVKSGVFDLAITAWTDKSTLIKGDVRVGDAIFGFVSDGQAAWEDQINSGIMSNGLTSARSTLMHGYYNYMLNLQRDPLPGHNPDFYTGRFQVEDKPEILGGLSVGAAILSPTRQWAIVIKKIVAALKSVDSLHLLHGITMNTGGGATKIRHLGRGGIRYIKKMPPPPPLFRLIQQESGEKWRNMYKAFNCGIGIDVIGEDNQIFHHALQLVAQECGLNLFNLGSCQKARQENKVTLETEFGKFNY